MAKETTTDMNSRELQVIMIAKKGAQQRSYPKVQQQRTGGMVKASSEESWGPLGDTLRIPQKSALDQSDKPRIRCEPGIRWSWTFTPMSPFHSQWNENIHIKVGLTGEFHWIMTTGSSYRGHQERFSSMLDNITNSSGLSSNRHQPWNPMFLSILQLFYFIVKPGSISVDFVLSYFQCCSVNQYKSSLF